MTKFNSIEAYQELNDKQMAEVNGGNAYTFGAWFIGACCGKPGATAAQMRMRNRRWM
ncbi:MAG: bacteriocin [Lactobacillaceae bacterium]|nr:bacteriocin [Lactobacillaceae bacterium]